MNVGIVTFFRPINNGAVLQACATNRIVLSKLGVDSELIDYRLPRIEYYRKCFSLLGCFKRKGIYNIIKGLGSTILFFPARIHQHNLYDSFIRNYLKVSNEVYTSYEELCQKCQHYDAYIVGSDLVWNPQMAEGINPIYFLQFVHDKPKISYAPSVGVPLMDDSIAKKIAEKAETLDFISVREKTSATQLQNLMKKKVETVLDPTLLTEADDWKDYYHSEPIIKGRYVFAFMLEKSNTLVNQVNSLAKKYDCAIVAYGYSREFKAKKIIRVANKTGPSEFLNLIKNAEYVVTNSFHGCAFSIIFHKEFYCVPHTERGIRMTDLMKSLNIENRMVRDQILNDENSIDYNEVERLREEKIEYSLIFLRDALLGESNE